MELRPESRVKEFMMLRVSIVGLFVLLSVGPISTLQAGVDTDGYERLPLIHQADFDIDLLVKPRASAANVNFLGFAVSNKTNAPLPFDESGGYSIDYDRHVGAVADGIFNYSGSLLSGNTRNLIQPDTSPDNTMPTSLPVGETRSLRSPSDQAMQSLGVLAPGSPTQRIHARVKLSFKYRGELIELPPNQANFEFHWSPPDSDGVDLMRTRVRFMLHRGDSKAGRSWMLQTLMECPQVTGSIEPADLLTGLDVWEQQGGPVLREFEAHHKHSEALLQYALSVISKRDYLRLGVLGDSTTLHDQRLIEPLEAWALTTQPGTELVMKLLSRQLDLAKDREALSAKLAESWLARHPDILHGKLTDKTGGVWTDEMRCLALTRDRGLVPRLVPRLEDPSIVLNADEIALANSGISTRACDVTYNTILDLLERPGERFELAEGFVDPKDQVALAKEYRRRDALIAALKRELTK